MREIVKLCWFFLSIIVIIYHQSTAFVIEFSRVCFSAFKLIFPSHLVWFVAVLVTYATML